jgi:hypothetical protein
MDTLKQLIAEHAESLKNYGDNYVQIAAHLNAATSIDNPNAGQEQTTEVDAPITMDDVTALVPPEEAAIIYVKAQGLIANMQQAIDANNRVWLTYLLQTAASPTIGALSANTITALTGLLGKKVQQVTVQPDKVSGPSLASSAGLGVVTTMQVQEAMTAK